MSEKEIETAVLVFAHYLGIDIEKEEELVDVAYEALENLPPDWQLGIGEDDNAGIPYFYNDITGESSWHHPEEKKYMKIIKQEKQRIAEKLTSKSSKPENNSKNIDTNSNINKKQENPVAAQKVEQKSLGQSQQQQKSQNQQQQQRLQNQSQAQKSQSQSRSQQRDDSSSDGDDMVEMLDVEEYNEPSPTIRQVGKSSSIANKSSLSGQTSYGQVSKPDAAVQGSTVTSAFSLNPSDFFDEPTTASTQSGADSIPQSPDSHWNKVKNDRSRAMNQDSSNAGNVAAGAVLSNQSKSLPSTVTSNTNTTQQQLQLPSSTATSSAVSSRNTSTKNDSNVNDIKQSNRASSPKNVRREQQDDRNKPQQQRDNQRQQQQRYDDVDKKRSESRGKDDRLRGKRYDDASGSYDDVTRATSAGRTQRRRENDDDYDQRPSSSSSSTRNRNDDRYSPRNYNSNNSKASSTIKDDNTSRGVKPAYDSINMDNSKYIISIQKLEQQLLDSQSEVTSLQQMIKDVRHKHDDEVEALKKYSRRIEDRAAEERDDKKSLQDKLLRLENEKAMQIHEVEDNNSDKIRDISKKIRLEVENEWKERLRLAERRLQDEVDDINAQLMIAKKRYDESMKEVENQKKRITVSREDGRLEMLTEYEETKQQLASSEQQGRVLGAEIKKLREDHISLSSRLTNMMQQLQVANAEADTARASNTTALNDYHASNAALISATQRIASMDVDNANLRAEVMALKREQEELHSSYRKLQSSTAINGDRLGLAETESKRIKQQSSHEISRLSSRVIELEAIVQQQIQQLNTSSTIESENVRELQRQLTKAEYSNTILSERTQDIEQHRHRDGIKQATLEKEIQSMEEQLYKRDRQLREEQISCQNIKDKHEITRKQLQDQVDDYMIKIRLLNDEKNELEASHHTVIMSLQQEVSTKLPALVAASMQQVESKYAQKLALELSDCRNQCEVTAEQRWRNKIHEIQSTLSEREAKAQRAVIEQKIENEELVQMVKMLKRRLNELEYELDHQHQVHNRSNRTLPLNQSYRTRDDDHHDNVTHNEEKSSTSILSHPSSSSSHAQTSRMKTSSVNHSIDASHGISMSATMEEATSFLIQSQLDTMRKQLGRYIDEPVSSQSMNISSMKYAINRSASSHIMMDDSMASSSHAQSIFLSPQRSHKALSTSYEIPSSLFRSSLSTSNINHDVQHGAKEYLDDAEESFDAIEDGGYHEGYWKAKYSSNAK